MDNNIHYFPGGNTPKGFYSYYDNISDQRETQRIICLKGGPGTGKSSIMKSIGAYFENSGEKVDYLWCSSDPDSLDGIEIKDRRIVMVDGTAPHVVDPINPGAVDEIVYLGDCWNESGIRSFRNEIIECGEKIGDAFKLAYLYLKSTGIRYEHISAILDNRSVRSNNAFLRKITDDISINKMDRGRCKKRFASAITHYGVINKLDKISAGLEKTYIMKVPIGYRTENILKPLAERFLGAGYDAELYYCPMDPEVKLEHVVLRELGIGIFTYNDYHEAEPVGTGNEIPVIETDCLGSATDHVYELLKSEAKGEIDKAIKAFKKAKTLHDELEAFYVSNMDFEKLNMIKNDLIKRMKGSL